MKKKYNFKANNLVGLLDQGKNYFSTPQTEPLKKSVMCHASFRGELTKEQLYPILDYIDGMKERGFTIVKHDRIDLDNGNVTINYELELMN